MKQVELYTDGACKGNPGKGGWGVLLRYGEQEKTLCGGEAQTTNNRMELQAAIEGLNALKSPCVVELHTDSEYLRKGITEWIHSWKKRGWKTAAGKAVKNVELWKALEQAAEPHQVNWHWVKGHAGHPDNERADELANLGIEQIGRSNA